MRLTNSRLMHLWKPGAIALVLLAAVIYAGLVIHEITRRTQLGAERRARAEATGTFVDEEAMLGAIWAHGHHPHDASWCPDYSQSFKKGCADAAGDNRDQRSAPPRACAIGDGC